MWRRCKQTKADRSGVFFVVRESSLLTELKGTVSLQHYNSLKPACCFWNWQILEKYWMKIKLMFTKNENKRAQSNAIHPETSQRDYQCRILILAKTSFTRKYFPIRIMVAWLNFGVALNSPSLRDITLPNTQRIQHLHNTVRFSHELNSVLWLQESFFSWPKRPPLWCLLELGCFSAKSIFPKHSGQSSAVISNHTNGTSDSLNRTTVTAKSSLSLPVHSLIIAK